MYINEQGEVVTDLAYKVALDKVADNPFDSGGPTQLDIDIEDLEVSKVPGSDEFVSGGRWLKLILVQNCFRG